MIRYVLVMGKQHLGPHVVVGYSIKIFWPGLFIASPDHLEISGIIPASKHLDEAMQTRKKYSIAFTKCFSKILTDFKRHNRVYTLSSKHTYQPLTAHVLSRVLYDRNCN